MPPGVNASSGGGNGTLPGKANVTLPGSKDIPIVENVTSTIIVEPEEPEEPEEDKVAEIPEDAVRTTLKMDGDFTDFKASGGEAKFTTALATNLEIDES